MAICRPLNVGRRILAGPARGALGAHQATRSPLRWTAAARHALEPHGAAPPPIAARSRWCRCRAFAEHMVVRRWQHFTALTCSNFAGPPGESTVWVGVDR